MKCIHILFKEYSDSFNPVYWPSLFRLSLLLALWNYFSRFYLHWNKLRCNLPLGPSCRLFWWCFSNTIYPFWYDERTLFSEWMIAIWFVEWEQESNKKILYYKKGNVWIDSTPFCFDLILLIIFIIKSIHQNYIRLWTVFGAKFTFEFNLKCEKITRDHKWKMKESSHM